MVNATASAVDTVSLHSAEVIAAAIARRMKLLRSSKKSSSLLMKSWDLSKAYKHLPLHESSLSDAFLCVWNPNSKQTVLYGQRVLPFGARSSVHGFCRTSLGIWVIGVSLFLLQWTVFFDDFVGCESPALAKTFDLCADGLFSLLGWDIAQDKASNFDTVAKILGLSVDLSDTSLGVVKLSNTENRKQEISDALEVFLQAGSLSRKDGERLRGRLQFAETQIAGKSASLAYRTLSKHINAGGGNLSPEVKDAMVTLKDRVVLAPPRLVCDRACYTWHLYVDASNDDNRSGVGGILVSENGSFIGHFSEFLEDEALRILNPHLSENPIFEFECFAIWCGLEVWSKLFKGCNLIAFTDNEGALNCMIHGASKNEVGGRIVLATHELCDVAHIYPWFERVNTASNLADRPSRGESSPNWGARLA